MHFYSFFLLSFNQVLNLLLITQYDLTVNLQIKTDALELRSSKSYEFSGKISTNMLRKCVAIIRLFVIFANRNS